MVALFGIGTIYLVYRAGTDFFNKKAAVFAVSLYAISPLVIAYSRSSWNPNLVPFFSLLYIYSLYKAVKTEKMKWYLLVGLSVGVGLQLHYLFTFLIPVGFIFVLLYKRGISYIRNYISVLAGVILPLVPFLGFEIKNRFPNGQTILRYILSEGDVGFSFANARKIIVDVIFRLFARLIFFFPPPEQLYKFDKSLMFWWKAVIIAAIILSVGLLIVKTVRKRKEHNILLLIWLILGVGLFTLYRKAIYDYYFGIIFTLPFLLLGDLLATLSNKKFLKLPVVGMFSGLMLLNWYGRPFKYPPNRQLEQVKQISRLVYEKTENKPFNFALITGSNSDHAYRYFLEIWGNSPVTIENFDNDPRRKTVKNQLLVVCESLPCKPLGHPLWEIAGFGRAQIVGEWDVSFVKVYKLIHFKGVNDNK
jgi:4-amino-4-deoxy-L-arabinose transferase-like glycosyltransferase